MPVFFPDFPDSAEPPDAVIARLNRRLDGAHMEIDTLRQWVLRLTAIIGELHGAPADRPPTAPLPEAALRGGDGIWRRPP